MLRQFVKLRISSLPKEAEEDGASQHWRDRDAITQGRWGIGNQSKRTSVLEETIDNV